MKTVIIGCGTGGIVSSHVIKKLDPGADVTIIGMEKSIFIRCAAPYILAGIDKIGKCVKPWSMATGTGTKLIHDEVLSVDIESRAVSTKSETFGYDNLVFSTGSKPFLLPIEGINLKNVFTIRTRDDTRKILKALENSRDVVVIGGGMIGVETAALLSDAFKVTIVEMLPSLLPSSFDREFSEKVENLLQKMGVKVCLGNGVEKLSGNKKVNAVHVANRDIKADVVLVTAGVRAETDLAKKSGIKTGKFGIKTDKYMRTNVKNVYAVGDCAETFWMTTGKPVQSGLVTTSVSQAKTAGMNIAGIKATFNGVLNPAVTEIFGNSLGRVGLTEEHARYEEIKCKVGMSETLNKYDTQPDAKPLTTKLLFNEKDKIIGAQAIGSGAIVTGIINLISFAIQMKSTIQDLLKINYAAHPQLTALPFADPVILACESVPYRKKYKQRK